MKIGDSCYHRGTGEHVEIIGEFSTHYQVRLGKQVFSASKIPGVDLMPVANHPEAIDLQEVDDSEKKTVNINQLSIEQISKSLSGVGKLAAKKIFERKPEGGYQGIENLKNSNADLSLNWEAISPYISF